VSQIFDFRLKHSTFKIFLAVDVIILQKILQESGGDTHFNALK